MRLLQGIQVFIFTYSEKYIHIIENAHHQDLGDQGGAIYREIVPAFFRENMRDSG